MKNRREFMKTTTAMLAAPALLSAAAKGRSSVTPRRRIIYNNDGDELLMPFTEGFLKAPKSESPKRQEGLRPAPRTCPYTFADE